LNVIERTEEARSQLARWCADGKSVGLIPTMGALHAGHLSLAQRSRDECDRTVATIFVNPTQFGPGEDFSRYPRTLDDDLQALGEQGVDLVFVPAQRELYPPGFSTYVEPPDVARELEGQYRPGHFRGVATIVLKLFHILPATAAYFGQKDYQQLAVIRRMTRDLNLPIQIVGCPTVREPDGLAMSSRNRYLSAADRPRALGLWSALQAAAQLFEQGQRDAPAIEQHMIQSLLQHGVDSIDYARVVDAESLMAVSPISGSAVALIAARIGNTRLIDNLILSSQTTTDRGTGDE
jgi:pantoate--beta-alanine ligase